MRTTASGLALAAVLTVLAVALIAKTPAQSGQQTGATSTSLELTPSNERAATVATKVTTTPKTATTPLKTATTESLAFWGDIRVGTDTANNYQANCIRTPHDPMGRIQCTVVVSFGPDGQDGGSLVASGLITTATGDTELIKTGSNRLLVIAGGTGGYEAWRGGWAQLKAGRMWLVR
jgi:hypothetical protein